VGDTLADRLERERRLSLRKTATLLLPAVSAVGTAHVRGIVHRDLKPSNIFLARSAARTVVKVLDFGIAKWTAPPDDPDSHHTQTGSTLGTPCYMAPEQATGERWVDHRVDVWALGVMLYECLAGVRPVEGANAAQVVLRLASTGIMPIEQLVTGLPVDIAELVRRMLARDLAQRLPDLRAAAQILARYATVGAPEFGEPGRELVHESIKITPGAADSATFLALAPTAPVPSMAPLPTTPLPTTPMTATVADPVRNTRKVGWLTALGVALALLVIGIWRGTTPTNQRTATIPQAPASNVAPPAASTPPVVSQAATGADSSSVGNAVPSAREVATRPIAAASRARRAPVISAPKSSTLPPGSAMPTPPGGKIRGATCERSSECASRLCAAHTCE
jgi:hypothetical protein